MDRPNLNPKKSLSKASKHLHNEDTKKINTAKINKALNKHKSLNRRQLAAATGIEICTLCLPLLRGVQNGTLIIAKYDYCPFKKSKRKVMYYALAKLGGNSNA